MGTMIVEKIAWLPINLLIVDGKGISSRRNWRDYNLASERIRAFAGLVHECLVFRRILL
jgi:hypothetical protein